MQSFISGYHCRRIVLDTVMDGRIGRARCKEGGERCDLCERKDRQRALREEQEEEADCNMSYNSVDDREFRVQEGIQMMRPWIGSNAGDDVNVAGRLMALAKMDGQRCQETEERLGGTEFERQRRKRQRIQTDFENMLAISADQYHLRQRRDRYHRLEDCIEPEADGVRKSVCSVKNEIQGMRRFAKYSCLFSLRSASQFARCGKRWDRMSKAATSRLRIWHVNTTTW